MKILVIDDSGFVRMFIEKIFTDYLPGAELHFGNNGEEGVSIFNDARPDIIITDLLMPKMGGLEFIQYVRNTDKDVKIIVISADIQKHVKEELEILNILAFINKPLNNDKSRQLLDIVNGDTNA